MSRNDIRSSDKLLDVTGRTSIGFRLKVKLSIDTWSARVLKTAAEVGQLNTTASHLFQQDEPTLDPAFFLASIDQEWKPWVVAVYRGSEVVGICYAKERVIHGVSTGVIYLDGGLGGFLLANPLHQQNVLRIAIETLWAAPGILGIRLRILQGGAEAEGVAHLVDSIPAHVRCAPVQRDGSGHWRHHAHLELPSTYAEFLDRLGYTTRHNFRYYRKRFEAAGHQFVPNLSMADLRAATRALNPKSKFFSEARQRNLEHALEMLAATKRPLAVGLRSSSGKWMGVIGGWYGPGEAVLMYQCNDDRDFSRDSLSTVLRSYLIEQLIQEGLPKLVIWSDTGPPLSRYVTYPPAMAVSLDVRSNAWRAAKKLASTVGPHLPRRLADAVVGYFDSCP